ncbi:ATP-binding protein [Pedobacter sp. SYSU D00535]|uniref:ATP-binding protein n=1 Tax=Pedobacter sp. SYSU D00535 TaxID=2810308 RepID=UPI001A96176D|nr:ATP-binding protein [Pedobacter sp. SYSU D00535]
MKNLLILLLAGITSLADAQEHKLSKIWETAPLAVPESVFPDFEKKILYVSLIDGAPWGVDGKGGVAKLDLQGNILDSVWITGLNAPKGMGRVGNKLYVADVTEVVEIDIPNSKISRKIAIDSAIALNDITVDDKGVVYVSDSRRGTVHQIVNGKVSTYLRNIEATNGLKSIGRDLYVISGPTILKVNPKKEITTIAGGFAKGGDGIEPVRKGDFIVSCWAGLVYHVSKNGKIELLLDTQAQGMNTADIGIKADENIVYVPTFNKRSVIAYKLINTN